MKKHIKIGDYVVVKLMCKHLWLVINADLSRMGLRKLNVMFVAA